MPRYVALVDGEAGAYGVVVPDLPGCTAMGDTVDEALRHAVDAVREWSDDALASGEAVPEPRDAEALRGEPDVAEALRTGSILAYVPLIVEALASG